MLSILTITSLQRSFSSDKLEKIFCTNHCLFIPNLHEKNIEITIDNMHKEKMSELFNFTEAELVNQEKSIQTLRIRLCIWSSKCTIKTNIFEIMSY